MHLEITRTTPIYRSPESMGVFLQWVVQNPTAAIDNIEIKRSGSPEGPFETVIDNINTYFFYDDYRDIPDGENLNYLSLSRQIYYKITATIGNDTVSTTEPVGDKLEGLQFRYRLKMQQDLFYSLKFSGVPFALLKRHHWGGRCETCFDVLTKKVTDSKCDTCFGTGFTQGYYDPVGIRGRIGVENVQTTLTPQGKSDINHKRLTVLTYPMVESDDILVELNRNNRYLVKHVATTELQTVPVHQRITLSELSRDSVEYKIPVDDATVPVIY